jgi:hypothetical protein
MRLSFLYVEMLQKVKKFSLAEASSTGTSETPKGK